MQRVTGSGATEYPPTQATRQREKARRGGCRVVSLFLLAISVLLSIGIGALALFEFRYQDRIYPGVYVETLDLSGMSRREAHQMLVDLFGRSDAWWPSLRLGDRTWRPTGEELGAIVDIEGTLDRAFSVGRDRDPLKALMSQADAARHGRTVDLLVRFDRAQARRYLTALTAEVRVPVREPSLRVDETHVEILPGQMGYELDEATTLDRIEERVLSLGGGEVELVVHTTQPVVTDISGVGERIARIISGPIELVGPEQLGTRRWVLNASDLAGMLVLQQRTGQDGTVQGVAALSEEALRQSVAQVAQEIDREPKEGKIDYDRQAGRVVVLEPSEKGYRLDVDQTITLIQEHALSQMRQVPLPVEELRPTIDTNNLSALGITSEIAKGTSSFKGSSEERMINITLATAQFDGVLVAPGEIFSFNKHLGEVTAESGYAESLVIWGDRTAVGIGGGICQVSTTAFRAAFWGGLEIVERWAHGYRVSWYEPPVGLDATVYSPSVDFKFRNDTPGYILIKTEIDPQAGILTFYFYGTDTGRTVEMIGPVEENVVPHGPPEYQDDPSLPVGVTKQVDWAHDGVDVTIKRIVRQGEEIIHNDTFFSRYEPWEAVYLVGTGGESSEEGGGGGE